MHILLVHLWLPYLFSLVFAGIVYAVTDKPQRKLKYGLLTAAAAALPNFIAVSGIWFLRSGYVGIAAIIALLCVIAVIIHALLIRSECRGEYEPAIIAGIGTAVLELLAVGMCCFTLGDDPRQTVLTACSFCGMLSTDFIAAYVTALIAGFQHE